MYQHSVARVVTVGVVDAFEIVKVNDQERGVAEVQLVQQGVESPAVV